MAVEFILDSLDQVEESFRGAYEERDGKFHLNADQYAELKAAGLKKKNAELLDGQKKLKEQYSKYERFKDVTEDDWESYQDYLEAKRNPDGSNSDSGKPASAAELEKAVSKEKQRFERQLRDSQEAARTSLAEKEKLIADLERQVKEFNVWTPVRDMATRFKVLPDCYEAFITALQYPRPRFDLDEDGKLIFKDREGYPTTLTPEKAFEVELKKEFRWAFEGTGMSGSGAHQSSSAAMRAELGKLSATERLKASRNAGITE